MLARTNRTCLRWCKPIAAGAVWLLSALTSHVGNGQEAGGSATSEANAFAAAEFAAGEAPRYRIQVGKSETPLTLEVKPLLRWSNPVRAEVYGNVMVWTERGCPAALASIYQYFDRKQINVEMVSLSAAPLVATRNGRTRWRTGPGVTFEPIPDAPPAADTPERRRLQMRTVAQKFSAHLAERTDDTKFTDLRLMSRPIYQYAASDKSGREGALFAFVTTNDPEVVLLVESSSDGPRRNWRYAAARLHFCRLQLKLGDKIVWDVPQLAPPWEQIRGPEGSYIILQWDTIEDAKLDADSRQ